MMSLSLVKGDGVACGSPPHGESKGEQPSRPPAFELRVETFVFRREEIQPGERRRPDRKRAGEPVQQIEVMTAFLENVRSGELPAAPPVAHDVRAMLRTDILIGVDAENRPMVPASSSALTLR